jgi:hypothetical protein
MSTSEGGCFGVAIWQLRQRVCIFSLQSLFTASSQCFAKAFSDGLEIQRSGGSEEAVCVHGGHYALLPIAKTESGLDAVNLFVHFKHKPNVGVYDHWCGCASQACCTCRRAGVELGSRAGAIYAEDTKDKKVVSVPELDSQLYPSFASSDAVLSADPSLGVERTQHPVSGSTLCVLAHDRLHGAPPNHKRCTGRDPDWIAQLRTMDSLAHEQYNSFREKQSHYLRNYSPQRYLLFLLVTAHLRNRRLAEDFLERAQKRMHEMQKQQPAAGWRLTVNEFGQVKLMPTVVA